MRPHCSLAFLAVVAGVLLMSSCTEETTGLKQKIADLEKKIEKQQKDLGEFAGRFSPPKDFSADIQRIEDQQDRISQVLKTQVEPINSRLEEFRDWAQDAQKEREEVRQKLKDLAQTVSQVERVAKARSKEIRRLIQELAAEKKRLRIVAKNMQALSQSIGEVKKEFADNKAKLVANLKKTLPRVRDSAVVQIKERLAPIEKSLLTLRTAIESDRKAIAALQTRTPPPNLAKEIRALHQKLVEMEEILASQKAYLLELGSTVHRLETGVH